MTNKEAISNLEELYPVVSEEKKQAIDKALEALEVLDQLVKMSDADGVYYACPECAHEFRKNATVQANFTAEALREAVARVDVMLRPYAVVCNPINADIIEKELGKQFKVLATPACEEGKGYLVDRKQFDKLTQIKPLEASHD